MNNNDTDENYPISSRDEVRFTMFRYEEYHKRLLQEYELGAFTTWGRIQQCYY